MQTETKVAWDSNQIGGSGCPKEHLGIEGQRVFIRTDRAIFHQALVIRETREALTVRYVEKTDRSGSPVTRTENVKRQDIRKFRTYKEI